MRAGIHVSGREPAGNGHEETLPHTEELREAILGERLDAFDFLTVTVRDATERHRVLTTLRDEVEWEKARPRKLRPRKGLAIDFEAEWNPEHDPNDDRSRAHLADMAAMRLDVHRLDFQTTVGYAYRLFFCGRVLDIPEGKLEHHERVALDIADHANWNHCQECGPIAPGKFLLEVQK